MKNALMEAGAGVQPQVRYALEAMSLIGPLPFIRGAWYFVDPTSGGTGRGGKSVDDAVASLEEAYDLCTSGAGDGIVVMSRGTGTASQTTSYQKKTLAWSKHGITVIGIASPVAWGSRARVANKEVSAAVTCVNTAHVFTRTAGSFLTDGWLVGMTGRTTTNDEAFTVTAVTALTMTVTEELTPVTSAAEQTLYSYIDYILLLTGSNNTFVNLLIGNYSSKVGSIGGIKLLSCARNAFINCQIIGAGHATPGAVATQSSIWLDEAEECLFERCVIGTDTVKKASTSGEIRLSSTVTGGGAAVTARIKFVDCDIISWSETSTKGGIISDSAISIARVIFFIRCNFVNWDPGALNNLASVFIGTAPTSGKFLMIDCVMHGYAVWDVVANAVMYNASGAVPAATGGLAIKAA
jgi:hypothetical protein